MTDVEITGNLNTDFVPNTDKKVVDPNKRPTFAEKLVGVQNSQCEQYLKRTQDKLRSNEFKQMTRIREETNRITYDLKTMKVMKKKRDLEVKRLKSPFLDTEQDEFEIRQAEKYLVFDPNICFYTNRKNRIPLRSLAKLDPYHTTPTIAKARKILQDMTNDRKVQQMQEKRAEMYSRAKSARSVRFQTPHSDQSTHNYKQSLTNNNNKWSDTVQSVPSHHTNTHVERNKTQSPFGHHSGGYEQTGLKKEEALLSYLKRAKIENDRRREILLNGNNAEDVPDDFTQCEIPNRSKETDHKLDHEDKTEFQLPSVTGEERSQIYVNSQMGQLNAPFGDIDKDIPQHEITLLKQANSYEKSDNLRQLQSPLRPSKSAGTATRTTSHGSQYYKRQMSATSASSIRRQQYTHAVMRKEKHEVESKVQNFLNTFEKKTPKHGNIMYSLISSNVLGENLSLNDKTNQAAVSFMAEEENNDQIDEKRLLRPKTAVELQQEQDANLEDFTKIQRAKTAITRTDKFQEKIPSPQLHTTSNVKKQLNMHSSLGTQQEKPIKVRGIPSNAEGRSKRHSATYKLRKIVQDLMKNRTTQQMLEYEKVRDDKEPE